MHKTEYLDELQDSLCITCGTDILLTILACVLCKLKLKWEKTTKVTSSQMDMEARGRAARVETSMTHERITTSRCLNMIRHGSCKKSTMLHTIRQRVIIMPVNISHLPRI
jgi:hypothetical protein